MNKTLIRYKKMTLNYQAQIKINYGGILYEQYYS